MSNMHLSTDVLNEPIFCIICSGPFFRFVDLEMHGSAHDVKFSLDELDATTESMEGISSTDHTHDILLVSHEDTLPPPSQQKLSREDLFEKTLVQPVFEYQPDRHTVNDQGLINYQPTAVSVTGLHVPAPRRSQAFMMNTSAFWQRRPVRYITDADDREQQPEPGGDCGTFNPHTAVLPGLKRLEQHRLPSKRIQGRPSEVLDHHPVRPTLMPAAIIARPAFAPALTRQHLAPIVTIARPVFAPAPATGIRPLKDYKFVHNDQHTMAAKRLTKRIKTTHELSSPGARRKRVNFVATELFLRSGSNGLNMGEPALSEDEASHTDQASLSPPGLLLPLRNELAPTSITPNLNSDESTSRYLPTRKHGMICMPIRSSWDRPIEVTARITPAGKEMGIEHVVKSSFDAELPPHTSTQDSTARSTSLRSHPLISTLSTPALQESPINSECLAGGTPVGFSSLCSIDRAGQSIADHHHIAHNLSTKSITGLGVSRAEHISRVNSNPIAHADKGKQASVDNQLPSAIHDVASNQMNHNQTTSLSHQIRSQILVNGSPAMTKCEWRSCNSAFAGPNASQELFTHLIDTHNAHIIGRGGAHQCKWKNCISKPRRDMLEMRGHLGTHVPGIKPYPCNRGCGECFVSQWRRTKHHKSCAGLSVPARPDHA